MAGAAGGRRQLPDYDQDLAEQESRGLSAMGADWQSLFEGDGFWWPCHDLARARSAQPQAGTPKASLFYPPITIPVHSRGGFFWP
jgi:hypothetical protein